jgi:UDP-glucose 4-epimerase
VVSANLAALNRGSGDFFNIGTGQGTKTGDLYEKILDAIKETGRVVSEEIFEMKKQLARPGDLEKSCLIVQKAADTLCWKPKVELNAGIRETLRWRLHSA